MLYVLASLFAFGSAALLPKKKSPFAHCADDPKCAQNSEVSSSMTTVMKLIEQSRVECRMANACPLSVQTVTGEEIPCADGVADVYPCENVDLLSFVSLADLGSSEADGNDIWGWKDPVTNDVYALVGLTDGSSFVDVTDPVNPLVVAYMPSNVGRQVTWRDLKVYQNTVYVVCDDSGTNKHGMQYYDLTQLRELKKARQEDPTAPVPQIEPDGTYSEFGRSHNIYINEETGFLYSIGTTTCRGGLHMVDLKGETPTYAGCFSEDGYTHDVECPVYHGPDTRYDGKEICFAYNEDTLTVVDVTDKANPHMLSRNPYETAQYTHQGWCTEDHKYLLLNDELDELYETVPGGFPVTYIWDISDLENPQEAGNFTSPVTSIDHNLYVKGNYVYESNYESGLRVLDLSNIENGELTQVAYFDVYPEADNVEFLGSWSVFPFYEEDIVVVQSIDRGLFVLRVNLN